MAHSFLVFDFGSNEEAAQQARHSVERWKQGFRLGKKLLLKFDRGENGATGAADNTALGQEKSKAGKTDAAKGAPSEKIVLMLRLDFSDHEKLSQQRWLERIPSEATFKDVHLKIIRSGDADFTAAAERFDRLD